MRYQIGRISCAGIALVGVCAFRLAAQSTSGDLVGIVTDASGAAIPQVQVNLVEEATGIQAAQTSDAHGQYRFNNLHIGRYDLSATVSGFAPFELKGVTIELNKTSTQNVTLSVQRLSQNVEVADAAETIDTSTAQIQTNFTSKLTADLPTASLPGGGVLNLSLLSAGVSNAGGVGIGEGPSVGRPAPL